MMIMMMAVGSINTKLHYSTLAIDLSSMKEVVGVLLTTYYKTRGRGRGGFVDSGDRQTSFMGKSEEYVGRLRSWICDC